MDSRRTSTGTTSKEILPLSSLRFIAAALVVLDHLQMFRGLEGIGSHTGHNLGGIGVSIFFVLSGYILSYTYLGNDWRQSAGTNTRKFFIARFARIYPLHWLMFVLALPLGLNSNTSRVSVSDFPWLLTLTNDFWPGFVAGPHPVTAAWTLSCEALFYLITPAIFFALAQTSRPLRWSVLLLVIYTSTISVLAIQFPALNWRAYLRVPEFLLGIVSFIHFRASPPVRFANILFFAGAILVGSAGLMLTTYVPYRFVPYLTAPGAALMITGCAFSTGMLRAALSRPRFVLLGHASYALYLLHDPGMRYMKVFTHRTGLDQTAAISILLGLTTAAGAIGGSILCYKYFETPCRMRIRKIFSGRGSVNQRPRKKLVAPIGANER